MSEIADLDRSATWIRTGKTFKVWNEHGPDVLAVCRFFSGQSFAPKSSHFYTPYATECSGLASGSVWKYEGSVFAVAKPNATANGATCGTGTVPLYRLYNDGHGGAPNHRYTTEISALDQMVAQHWIVEGDGVTKVFACVPQ